MTDRKEYVERGAAYEIIETEGKRIGMTVCNRLNCKELLLRVPAADVVEVVRCRECKHITPVEGGLPLCTLHNTAVVYNDYCSYGERKDGADNGN